MKHYLKIGSLIISTGTGISTGYEVALNTWRYQGSNVVVNWLKEDPYDVIDDSIEIQIQGTSQSDALDKLEALISAINSANAAAARSVPFQTMQFKLNNPTGAIKLTARVYNMQLPKNVLNPNFLTYADTALLYITINFRRSGFWYTTTTYAGATANTANGTNVSGTLASFPTNRVILPVSYRIQGWNVQSAADQAAIGAGTLIVQHAAAGESAMPIYNYPANVAGTGAPYTSVADSSNRPSNGQTNVLLFTPTTLNPAIGRFASNQTLSPRSRVHAVFLKYRDNTYSFNYTYRIRVLIYTPGLGQIIASSDYRVTSANSGAVTVLSLGLIPIPLQDRIDLAIEITPSSISGGPTLSIDQIVLTPIDQLYTSIIKYPVMRAPDGSADSAFYLNFNHNFDHATRTTPSVLTENLSGRFGLGDQNAYEGRPYGFAGAGSFNALVMGRPFTNTTVWTYQDSGGGPSTTLTLTATALDTYVMPN